MKKLVSLCLFLSLFCAMGVTAYAADDPPGGAPPDTTVTITSTSDTEVALVVDTGQEQTPSSGSGTSLQPISVKMEMVGDVPYITKTYEIPNGPDAAAQTASLDNYHYFDQDGYRFSRHDAYTQIQADEVESRTETKTATLDVKSDDIDAVVAAADPYIDYDKNGFTGRLTLDKSSIHFESNGQESYRFRVEDVREYNNLDRQDMAYIPKTVMKNGVELGIENCEWIVMGKTPTDDGLVANLFKAVVTYAGAGTGSKVSGYTATFQYTGTVEKAIPGGKLVSVVFRGEKIVAPEPEPVRKTPVFPIVAFSLAGVALLAFAAVIFLSRSRFCDKKDMAEKKICVADIRGAAEHGYDESIAEPGLYDWNDEENTDNEGEDNYGSEEKVDENEGYAGYDEDGEAGIFDDEP